MKICVAGQGAFGQKHLDALKRIPDVEVTSLVGGNQDATAELAKKYGIPHYTGDLSEGIKRADAVILTTPTKMHFRQGEQVMRAGKHVLVEIPVTDSVEDAEAGGRGDGPPDDTGVVREGGRVDVDPGARLRRQGAPPILGAVCSVTAGILARPTIRYSAARRRGSMSSMRPSRRRQ